MLTLACCQDHIVKMRGGVTDAGRTTNNRTVQIELLSQWKLEAEFRNCTPTIIGLNQKSCSPIIAWMFRAIQCAVLCGCRRTLVAIIQDTVHCALYLAHSAVKRSEASHHLKPSCWHPPLLLRTSYVFKLHTFR